MDHIGLEEYAHLEGDEKLEALKAAYLRANTAFSEASASLGDAQEAWFEEHCKQKGLAGKVITIKEHGYKYVKTRLIFVTQHNFLCSHWRGDYKITTYAFQGRELNASGKWGSVKTIRRWSEFRLHDPATDPPFPPTPPLEEER